MNPKFKAINTLYHAFNPIETFFYRLPALHYACFAILGILSFFLEHFYFLGSLFLLTTRWKRFLLGIGLMGMSYFSLSHRVQVSPIPKEGVEGVAHVCFNSLKSQDGQWLYQGTLLKFYGDIDLRNLPFSLKLTDHLRYPADQEYLIYVRVFPFFGGRLHLKTLKDFTWEKVRSTGIAEWRFYLKSKAKDWIQAHYTSPSTRHFLVGLMVGEFDDKELKEQFGKFGLLHLLAISGFHFSLVATLIDRLMRLFLSRNGASLCTIVCLGAYFLFLGWGPSVVRAWMMISLFYSALLLKKQNQALNSLGTALLLATLIDPFLLFNLGFQFSVSCTIAILLLQKPMGLVLNWFFPKRSYLDVFSWPYTTQVAYVFLGWIKNAANLSLATSLVCLPLSLYYFHYFPLMSLVYNLFFPFLAAMSIQLLMLALFIPPLHYVNDFFTSWILNFTHDTPESWNLMLCCEGLPSFFVLFVIILIFLLSIYFQKFNKPLIFNHPI